MFTVFVDVPLTSRIVLPLHSGGPHACSVKYLQDTVTALVPVRERLVTILCGHNCVVFARSRSPVEEARGDRLDNSDMHSVSEGVEGGFSRFRQLMLGRKPLE